MDVKVSRAVGIKVQLVSVDGAVGFEVEPARYWWSMCMLMLHAHVHVAEHLDLQLV